MNNQQNPSKKIEQSCINAGKSYDAMQDKNKLVALLKVITGIYNKNPGMQEMIDAWMIEV